MNWCPSVLVHRRQLTSVGADESFNQPGRGEGDDYEGVGWEGRVDCPYNAVGLDRKLYAL